MNNSVVRMCQFVRSIVSVHRSSTAMAAKLSVLICVSVMAACAGPVNPVPTKDPQGISPAVAESAQVAKSAEPVPVEPAGSPPLPLPLPSSALDSAREAPTSVEGEPPVLEARPVQVTAQRESYSVSHAQTATKTDTPLMDTPMSVKVVPQQVMLDQQVVRIDQALRNVSGVISGAEGDQQFNVRGFDQFNFYRDGYPFQSQWFHGEDLTNIDRVEVLKGPGSILYGRSEPAGIINFVTKQPLDTPYYSLRQQFGSYGWFRTNADLTGPLTEDKRVSYRFNLGYQMNQNFQEFGGNERLIIAPQIR